MRTAWNSHMLQRTGERQLVEIVIREAGESDYEALCALYAEVDAIHRDALPERFRAPPGAAREREYLANAVRAKEVGLFVAEVCDQLVGLVHVLVRDMPAVPICVPRRYAVVDSLAVAAAHRRGGVGRALMRRAEAWARSKGATSIELTVYAFNKGGLDFYRVLGYETLSQRMSRSLGTPEDES